VPLQRVTIAAPNARGAIVAYRSGDDAWQYATGGDLPITFRAADDYSVAIGCVSSNEAVGYVLSVYELTQLTSDLHCAPSPGGTATLSGSIAVPYDGTSSIAAIAWGDATTTITVTDASAELAVTVSAGTRDVVAGWYRPGPGGLYYERATIVRDIVVSGDTTIPVIDLTAPSSALLGGTAGHVGVVSTLLTASGTRFQLSSTKPYLDSFSYLPEAELGPDDRHELAYYVEGVAGLRVYSIMRKPGALSDVALPPRPTFDNNVVRWVPVPGATAYALRSVRRTVFVSPEVFDNTSTLTAALPPGSPEWPFSQGGGWEAAVIMTPASLDDAIRLVPRADTTIIGFR
jgi:hypothetical protein